MALINFNPWSGMGSSGGSFGIDPKLLQYLMTQQGRLPANTMQSDVMPDDNAVTKGGRKIKLSTPKFIEKLGEKAKEGLSKIDPTNPDSIQREFLREIDITNEDSALREGLEKIDWTNPESIQREVLRESDITNENSALRGGLSRIDWTNPESIQREFLSKIDITNPDSWQRGALREIDDELGLSDKANDILDGAKDLASGRTDGDASLEMFGKFWPYKEELLDRSSELFKDPSTLYPDFSSDTNSYLSRLRTRSQQGNSLVDQAGETLSGMYGQTDPTNDFYRNQMMGGQNNPASNFFSNAMTGKAFGSNPADDYYRQIASGQRQDPTQDFFSQVKGGQFDNQGPGAQVFSELAKGSLGSDDPYQNDLYGISQRVGRNPATGMLNDAASMYSNNPATSQLQKTAMGGYLENNPYLDATYNKAADAVTRSFKNATDSLNSQFGGAGRFGSFRNQQKVGEQMYNLGDTLSNLATDIYGQDYGRERDRMLNATGQIGDLNLRGAGGLANTAGQIGNIYSGDTGLMQDIGRAKSQMYNTGLDRRLQGATGNTDIYNTNINRRMSGAGTLSNMFNTQTDNMITGAGGLNNSYFGNINNRFRGAGGASDLYNQDMGYQFQGAGGLSNNWNDQFSNNMGAINAAFPFASNDYTDINYAGTIGNMYDTLNRQRANEPWDRVSNYNAAIGGIPTGGTPQQGGNPLMGALGGAATGFGITKNPWGALGGGLLGFMGGM